LRRPFLRDGCIHDRSFFAQGRTAGVVWNIHRLLPLFDLRALASDAGKTRTKKTEKTTTQRTKTSQQATVQKKLGVPKMKNIDAKGARHSAQTARAVAVGSL
jgi:hypothetical protein